MMARPQPVSATEMIPSTAGSRSSGRVLPARALGLCVLGLGPLSVAASAQSSWADWPLKLRSAEDRGLQGLEQDRRARRALSGSQSPLSNPRVPKEAPRPEFCLPCQSQLSFMDVEYTWYGLCHRVSFVECLPWVWLCCDPSWRPQ